MSAIRSTLPRPTRPAGRGGSEFTELAHRIRSLGLLRRRYGYYWSKLIGLPLVLVAAIGLFVWLGDTWWQLFTAAALGVVFTQIAFLGHDAAHRQIFVSGKWNDWISLLLGDLLIGMSYGWWQHKHTRHHANPNKLGADPDIELPVIAVTADASARPRPRALAWLQAHRNIRGSRMLDMAMGGLNYQIEHHLFPSMPRPHLRRAAPVIAEYCRSHGVPYTQVGLFASYGIVVGYINRVGLGERDAFACPLVEQRSHLLPG